jgi:signal transduction histidine kinase
VIRRLAPIVAWTCAGLASAGAVALIVLVAAVPRSPGILTSANGINVCVGLGFSIVGAVIASRRPENAVGWIMIGIALCAVTQGLSLEYALLAIAHGVPGAVWAAWLQSWVSSLIVPAGLLLLLFALFPTGRSLSPRWRWLTLAGVVWTVLGVAIGVASRVPIELVSGLHRIANPLGVLPASVSNGPFAGVLWVAGLGLLATSAVAAVVRLRRSTGDERQQMKWFVYVVGATVVLWIPTTLFPSSNGTLGEMVQNLIPMIGFGTALPVACGVAILKYDLYEIDVVINKTVVYGLLAAFVTVVYVGIVVGIGALVGSRGNIFLSIVATAIVAVSFQPVRERARRLANRLVYGKRATPYEVLSRFSDRLGGVTATDDLLPQMARILGEGTGASDVAVWVRVGSRLHRAASWPTATNHDEWLDATGEELPPIPASDRIAAVRDGGELLGALAISKPPGDPVTAAENKLVSDLATQAGLVLRNVRLIEELRASRQRLVRAQDEERRRIERNIHDGAQQQLVAMALKLSLAHALVGKDPDRERSMLEQMKQEAQDALEDLRDLARGIYPPLLADRGLPEALKAQARKSAIPIDVETDGVGRYPQEVEAAVYFCALEALQNVAKYAGATAASVRLSTSNGDLRFEVADNGAGFDPAATGYGTGLQGMNDRLEALGGALDVRSSPGGGTTVSGRVPATAAEGAV